MLLVVLELGHEQGVGGATFAGEVEHAAVRLLRFDRHVKLRCYATVEHREVGLWLGRGGEVFVDAVVFATWRRGVGVEVARHRAAVRELHQEVDDPFQPSSLLLGIGHQRPLAREGVGECQTIDSVGALVGLDGYPM